MNRFVNKSWFKTKKIIPFLLILLLLIIPIQANASIISEENLESQEKPSVLEKQFSKFVLNVINSLIGITGAQDVSVLVFQRPEVVNTDTWISNSSSANRSDLVFGIFPEGAFNGIAEVYDNFANLLPIPMVIILVLGALFLLIDIFRSNENRTQLKEYLLGSIAAILLLRFGYLLWDWIIFINYALIVDPIYFMLQNNGIQITSFISTIWDQGSTEEVFSSTNFFIALIVLCAGFMTFSINYQYMIRTLSLGVLIVLFPFAVICTIIPSRRNVLNQWFMLFTAQVFIQGAHAIVLGLFFLFMATGTGGLDFWLTLVMFFGLPMMADIVQRFVGSIFGDSSASGKLGASVKNASGLTTMMGMVGLGKSMMKSNGSSSSTARSSTNRNQTKNTNTQANATKLNNANSKEGLASSAGLHNSKNGSKGSTPGQHTQSGTFNQHANSAIGDGLDRGSSSSVTEHGTLNAVPEQGPSNSLAEHVPSNQSMFNVNAPSRFNAPPKTKNTKKPLNTFAKVGQSTGRKIANGARLIGDSDGVKRTARLATMGGLMLAGAAVGTMVTGKSNGGAAVGAGVGYIAGQGVATTISKGAKVTQVGGEMLQSKSEGNGALDATKERIGYHHQSQLADASEMSRMGRELIGGKTGEVLGRAAGKINYAAGEHNISSPHGNNYNARQNYETVREREQLVSNAIPQSQAKVVEAKDRLDEAQKRASLLKARSIAEPDNNKIKNQAKIANMQQARMQILYETRKTNHEQLVNKAEQFYERQKLKSDAENLRYSRKSSGALA
jgi:hypothetical protein